MICFLRNFCLVPPFCVCVCALLWCTGHSRVCSPRQGPRCVFLSGPVHSSWACIIVCMTIFGCFWCAFIEDSTHFCAYIIAWLSDYFLRAPFSGSDIWSEKAFAHFCLPFGSRSCTTCVSAAYCGHRWDSLPGCVCDKRAFITLVRLLMTCIISRRALTFSPRFLGPLLGLLWAWVGERGGVLSE